MKPLTALLGMLLLVPSLKAQSVDDLLKHAAAALGSGRLDDALGYANQAVEKDKKSADALYMRGAVHDALGQQDKALADFSQVITLSPKLAEAYHQRGCVQFKLSRFKESVADFDKYIDLRPDRKASHWQRGISHYYAAMYKEGRQQFEGYQEFDSNDVENAVWRYMCMAKSDGIPAARKDLLKIGDDKRVPMRQVYEMFAGRLTPEEVVAAAVKGDPAAALKSRQLFYAHLYVGIHWDLEGQPKKALEHLNKATDEHKIGHYMWDVARVHRDLLRRQLEKGK